MPAKKKETRRVRTVVEEVKKQDAPHSTAPITAAELESAEESAKKAIEGLESLRKARAQERSEAPEEGALSQVSDSPSKDGSDGVSIKLVVLVAVFTAIIVAIVSGGVYVYYTGITNRQQEEEIEVDAPQNTPSPTISPTSEPEAATDVDVKDYKVSVLNGSGQIGAAGDASELIEEVDFVVSDTGNATSFGFTDTIIKAKKSVPTPVITLLKEALSTSYSVTIGDNLGPTDEFDIVVTVGVKQ